MIVWNGFDLVELIILIIILAIILLGVFIAKVNNRFADHRKKRNDRLWEKYGDKDNEDR
ncbi:MAG: hypothetical protein IKN54_05485 [Lachnospiraceae bacterium]|nr:hypothetical protein [Lachnospiraceae bacterium]